MSFLNSNKRTIYIASLIFIALLSITYRFSLIENIAAQDISSVREGDTARYEIPALHFLEHGTLAIDPQDVNTQTLQHAPGYALFIAANYYVFGKDELMLLKVQIVVSALTILILAFAAYLLWSWKASLITACIMAIDPLQTLYSHVMLTETLQFFFVAQIIVFAVLLFGSKRSGKSYLWAFLLGLVIALSAYVHTSTYYLVIPVILGMILLRNSLAWSKKQLAKVIVFTLIPIVILFSAWHIRNGMLTGVYKFSDNSTTLLLNWKASSVYVKRDGLTIDEAVKKIRSQLPGEYASLQERYDAEKELAINVITNNLGDFIAHSLERYAYVLFGPGLDSFAKHYDSQYEGKLISGVSNSSNPFVREIENATGKQFWYASVVLYSFVFLGACYLFMVIGYYAAFKSSSKQYRVIHLFLLGLVTYYILLSTGHVDGYHRYRLTSMLVVLLYSANGIRVVTRHFVYAKLFDKGTDRPFSYS